MSIIQLRRYQRRDADLTAVAASNVASAWTAYTPTVTAGSGAFTTASAVGKYLTIGKLTFVRIAVTITTNGTAATSVIASLPNTTSLSFILAGRETASTGKMLAGIASGTTVTLLNYDNTYPGGSGFILLASGSYENA